MQDIQQQEQKMQQFHSTAMQDLQRQQAAPDGSHPGEDSERHSGSR